MIKKDIPDSHETNRVYCVDNSLRLTDGEFALAGLRLERSHVTHCFLLGFFLFPLGELRFVLAGVLADEQVVALVAETDVIGE